MYQINNEGFLTKKQIEYKSTQIIIIIILL